MANIDDIRRRHLAFAEFIDAWRLIPRGILVAYGWLCYETWEWYTKLEPHLPKEIIPMIDKLTPEQIKSFMVEAPTTQHAALVTTVVGVAAAVIGLYTSSGRKWDGFISWKPSDDTTETKTESSSAVNWRESKKERSPGE